MPKNNAYRNNEQTKNTESRANQRQHPEIRSEELSRNTRERRSRGENLKVRSAEEIKIPISMKLGDKSTNSL